MKLSPRLRKVFLRIENQKSKFLTNVSKNKVYANMLANNIINKCDLFYRIYSNERAENPRNIFLEMERDYEIESYIFETKDFIKNMLENPPTQNNILRDYLEGVINENN